MRIAIDPDLQVWADPDRLEQILVNLLTNALRHGPRHIELTAGTGDGQVQIAVRVHGRGVPTDAQQALFERFSTADTAPGRSGCVWGSSDSSPKPTRQTP